MCFSIFLNTSLTLVIITSKEEESVMNIIMVLKIDDSILSIK